MSYRTTRTSCLRRLLRRTATAVAAAALVCGPAAGLASAAGPLASTHRQAPLRQAPADASQQFLHLSIDSVTPQMVEPNSPATVTVTGSVANIGDRDVSDVQVRLQRADPVAEPEQLRTALQLDQDSYHTVGPFHQISGVLKEGATARFALTLPLRSTTAASLDITEPGVYPLLVNVNGTPDYGGPARLDDARFLLPVIGLPADRSAGEPSDADLPAAPAQPPVLPRTGAPVPTTLLYPLANAPKLAAGVPGQPVGDPNATTLLIDDSLAESLAPGGRLYGILSAIDAAVHPGGGLAPADDATTAAPGQPTPATSGTGQASAPDNLPPPRAVADPAVAAGLCVAIDPDLLVTVDAMTRGYRVTTDPADPSAETTPGTGVDAARDWLAALRQLAGGMCTVAMPYAQSELDAVVAVGNAELIGEAAVSPEELVNQILGATGVSGMLWPATGQLGVDSANALPATEPTTLLLAANATTEGGSAMALAEVNPLLRATSFDLPAAAALAATGSEPSTPTFVPEDLRYRLDNDSRAARLQDAIGALSWPMISRTAPAAGETAPPGSPDPGAARPPAPVIIAPPQLWSVGHDEAAAVLTAYQRLIANGLAVSRTLPDALAQAQAPDAPLAGLVEPAAADETSDTDATGSEDAAGSWDLLVGEVRAILPRMSSLRSFLVDVPNAGVTPDGYLRPLAQDLLRTLSTAGRDGQSSQSAESAAQSRVTALDASLDEQFQAVTVLAPGSVYTLASSQSPLLLVAKNDLPIAVKVRLEISAPAGVNINNVDDYVLPARGSRQIQVPAEIEFSRQIDLRVGLLAPDGAVLGEEIHISLHSNAYGNLIPIITAVFGALLILLGGRRAWHRIKGKPDPSDARRPVNHPPEKPAAES